MIKIQITDEDNDSWEVYRLTEEAITTEPQIIEKVLQHLQEKLKWNRTHRINDTKAMWGKHRIE